VACLTHGTHETQLSFSAHSFSLSLLFFSNFEPSYSNGSLDSLKILNSQSGKSVFLFVLDPILSSRSLSLSNFSFFLLTSLQRLWFFESDNILLIFSRVFIRSKFCLCSTILVFYDKFSIKIQSYLSCLFIEIWRILERVLGI